MPSRPAYKQSTDRRTWITRSVIALLLLASGYLVFEFGRIKAGYDTVEAAAEREALQLHIRTLDDEIVALKQEIAVSETHRDVDREAYKEVESSLATLQAKIQEQQDAIAFYRGIVSPSDGNAGLRVQDLKLVRNGDEREFDLRLVLVQAMKHDRKVSGDVVLSVEGEQDGVEKILQFADLVGEGADTKWAFSFRYFRILTGSWCCPTDLHPNASKLRYAHAPARSQVLKRASLGTRSRADGDQDVSQEPTNSPHRVYGRAQQ